MKQFFEMTPVRMFKNCGKESSANFCFLSSDEARCRNRKNECVLHTLISNNIFCILPKYSHINIFLKNGRCPLSKVLGDMRKRCTDSTDMNNCKLFTGDGTKRYAHYYMIMNNKLENITLYNGDRPDRYA